MRPVRVRTVRPELGFCVEWTGATIARGSGYGKRWHNGRLQLTHRIAFFEYHGRWPNVCRHKCDNGMCFRIDHLEDGTQADNVHDTMKRGRARSARGNAKLNPEAVRCIRWLHANRPGLSQRKIAEAYGLGEETVRLVITRQTWGDV